MSVSKTFFMFSFLIFLMSVIYIVSLINFLITPSLENVEGVLESLEKAVPQEIF